MFGGEEQLKLLVTLRDNASAQLKQLEGALNGLSGQTKELEAQSQRASLGIGSIVKAAAGFFAVQQLGGALRDSVREAAGAQEVQTRLAVTLQNATGASEAQIASLNEQASALSRLTTLDAQSITAAQARLASFNLQSESIKRLIPSLLDFTVSEQGAAVSTETLTNYANGLGKALQGQTDQLVKSGFQFTEAQMQLLKYGDESERVRALTEILDGTYRGTAETVGQTFEGAMIRATNSLNDMKEVVGRALIPTINSLLESFISTANGISINGDTVNEWAKRIYQATNFVIALAKALKVVIDVVVAVGDAIYEMGKMALSPFKAIGQAITGDFTGAFDTLKNASSDAWKNIGEKAKGWTETIKDDFASVGESAVKAFDGAGFVPMAAKIDNALKNTAGAIADTASVSEKASKETEKLADKQQALAEAYDDTKQKATDALYDLEKKHSDFQSDIAQKIDAVRGKLGELRQSYQNTLNDLSAGFLSGQASDRKNIAADVVAQEKKIAELKARASTEKDPFARRDLKAQLEAEEQAYADNADFIKGLEAEIAEERRRQALTEFERQVEDYNARRAQAEQEYQARRADALAEYAAKKAELQREREALREQASEEARIYREKADTITVILLQAEVDRLMQTMNTHNATVALIDRQIDKYKQLAEAIKRAGEGRPDAIKKYATGGVVPGLPSQAVPIIAHGGERVIPMHSADRGTQGGAVNITVNYPQFKSEDDMRKFERQLATVMRDVGLNYRT